MADVKDMMVSCPNCGQAYLLRSNMSTDALADAPGVFAVSHVCPACGTRTLCYKTNATIERRRTELMGILQAFRDAPNAGKVAAKQKYEEGLEAFKLLFNELNPPNSLEEPNENGDNSA